MPLDPIDVGTNPGDGTGTPNRTAWQKVNTMLTEVYALLANTVDLTAFNDSLADTTAALASFVTALADKVGSATLLAYAQLSQVIRGDAPAALTLAYRRQAAVNSGHLSTLCFKILAADLDIDGAANIQGLWLVELPRFPKNFSIVDGWLAATVFPAPIITNTFQVTLVIQHGPTYPGDYVALVSGVNMTDAGLLPLAIIATESLVQAERPLTINIQIDRIDFGVGSGKGLDLWLRGVWKD